MTQAFEGITILDFTQVLAGPFGVMQLALLGARVIKVEQPGSGDQTRGLMNEGKDAGMSPSFMAVNLNKQSITLNLKEDGAEEIIKKLIPQVDVLVENFKAGTMERMGLDYETLVAIKPDLIYCSVTGYGQAGPKAGEAAYDGAIQASSGMMSQTGHPETGPTRTGYMPVDMSTALNTAFAISASLHRRAVTGEGQRLDIAMMDTAVVMQAAQYSNYLNQGSLVGLRGNASPTRQPTADVFPTSDGFIQITALRQAQVEKLFAELGIAELLSEPDFATEKSRPQIPEKVQEVMIKALATQTTAGWMQQLSSVGIPVAEVRELPEVVDDEQLALRGTFVSVSNPLKPEEDVRLVKAGYVTNADGPQVRNGPPMLGADTDAVLTELGYSNSDIEDLRDRGVI